MAGYQTYKADVKVGTGQALSFQKGKGYYAKASGGARPAGGGAAATDPFAPMSGAQIANQIAGYTSRLPQPLTDPQITQRAQQTIDPLIASLTSRAQAQGKAAAGAIGGYANSVSSALGGYADSAKGIYGGAEQSQAAADAALSDALRGGGNGLADALSGKLAAIGGNTGGLVDQTRQAGVGGGNALLATGSASLANLLAHGTAAQDEAAKMPGIALRQGQSDIRDATLANNKSLADNLSGVTSQLPGIVSGLRSSNDAKSTAIANAGEQVRQYETGRNDANAKFVRAEQDAGLTATTKATATASATAAKDAKPNATLSKSMGYVVDSNGNAITNKDGTPHLLPGYKVDASGQVVKTSTGKKTSAPKLTPAQVQTYRGTATTIAENAANGFTAVTKSPDYKSTTPGDPKGWSEANSDGKTYSNHHPSLGWSAAYDEMLKAGVPDQIAKAALKRYYGDHDPSTNTNVSGPPLPKGQ